MRNLFLVAGLSVMMSACQPHEAKQSSGSPADSVSLGKGTFAYDLAFLKKHKEVLVLASSNTNAKVAVIGAYQGRVMTSTAKGDSGNSFGWINYRFIDADSIVPHMNPFGGEDRIWVGPEGGQYSVFFKPGSSFDFQQWQTPPVIDSEPYELASHDSVQATFRKSAVLTNYSGFTFHFDINRQVKLWSNSDIEKEFGITLNGVSAVAFESKNSITNTGTEAWTKKNGLISIWILGMLSPSDGTTIILPYEKGPGNEAKITDDYFGKIPADRLVKGEGTLLLKADGKYRGKVGVAPAVARNVAGSYDADRHILTLVKFDLDKRSGYVNSKWEVQKNPFGGDAVNAYNDGPLADGSQMGPFYEIESSSPAKELKPSEAVVHRHITLHLEGDEKTLSAICKTVLGVSLSEL